VCEPQSAGVSIGERSLDVNLATSGAQPRSRAALPSRAPQPNADVNMATSRRGRAPLARPACRRIHSPPRFCRP